jgi:hypothetical protein
MVNFASIILVTHTREGYLRATAKQPSLFSMKPATVIGNIEDVAEHFKADGLTREAYLRVALKHPPLFVMKPGTIIGHVNLATELQRKGVVALPESPRAPPSETRSVLNLMLNNPKLFTLANENYAVREIHARLVDNKRINVSLNITRNVIEAELAQSLGHADQTRPVPKVDVLDGGASHARNLLLRALVREGWVKGRLE